MESRLELLHSLLKFDRPVSQIDSLLGEYGWDSEEELVTLLPEHVASVLERYLQGDLLAEDVEEWAGAIEGRDDIGYPVETREILKDVIFELAQPFLTAPLSREIAFSLLTQLY